VEYASESLPLSPPVLLFVGTLSAIKGFSLFLDVARRFPSGHIQAVACIPFIPKGAEKLARDAINAGVMLRIGLVNPCEIFKGASLLLQCTDSSLVTETFSLVTAEAMACGIPVATTGMAVGREILGDALAFDVPERDADLIVRNVFLLLNDPTRLEELRGASRARRARYSFEVFQKNVSTIISF
jgi:glycosyltransferase involved in cell wall biosynthesis